MIPTRGGYYYGWSPDCSELSPAFDAQTPAAKGGRKEPPPQEEEEDEEDEEVGDGDDDEEEETEGEGGGGPEAEAEEEMEEEEEEDSEGGGAEATRPPNSEVRPALLRLSVLFSGFPWREFGRGRRSGACRL